MIIGDTNEIFKLDESAEDLPTEIVEQITDIIKIQKLQEVEHDSTEFEPDYYFDDMYIFDKIQEFIERYNILYLNRHKCPPYRIEFNRSKGKIDAVE